MATKWVTALPGIRYREHAERRLKNGRPDRYYSIRYSVDGRQREEGLGWASEGWTTDKAQGVLAKLKEHSRMGSGARTLAELRTENEQRRHEQDLSELTLSHYFDNHYLPSVQKRKRTWTHDRGRFDKEIRPTLGAYPLLGITSEHIEECLQSIRGKGAAEATVLQYAALLRQIFNSAKSTMIKGQPVFAKASPLVGVRLPKAVVERERFLTYQEADTLLAVCRDLSRDLAEFVTLALNTGLRFGELMRLKWVDVAIPHATLSVRHEDQRKPGGRVPLNAEATAVLHDRLSRRERGEQLVFPAQIMGKDGFTMHRLYAKAVDVCGLNTDSTGPRDKIVFHSLRHTFASWLAISGRADIYRIKTLMRHKTIRMTERYAHLLPDATRDAVEHLRPSQCSDILDALDAERRDDPVNQ